jgi:hypothetical protein
MPKVEIRDKRILVDGKPVPSLSGEVHYWRLAPARWREILERVREMGLRTVASYVCWEYHEVEPGKFDFTGETEPQRDLIGFLDLLREMGFWVLIRPGPYIYSEWQNAGVPDRVATCHRLSEEYRAAALPWMNAVTEAVRPYFATNGGPILAFQPDNEMDLFTHWFEDELGLRGGGGLFQQFLRERYGDIARLNDVWGTRFEEFAQVSAWAEAPDAAARPAVLDYWRFQHWAVAAAVKWHADAYREMGVDIPVYHNYYYGGDVQNWRELAEVVDFLGTDVYPGNEFEQSGYPKTHREFLDGLRYQRSVSPIPYIAEFEAGVWHGLHEWAGVITPNHYRLTCFSALSAGIAGWNWYMLVNRDNWYSCPIQEWGRVRGELFSVFQGIVRVCDELDPPSLEKLTDTAVTVDPLQMAADGTLRRNSLLEALYQADVDYETYDLQTGRTARPLLFYAGSEWLRREDQERLRAYVEGGGTLICFKTCPRLDEDLRPCNVLGVAEPVRVLTAIGKRVELQVGEHRPVATGSLHEFDAPPGAERIRAVQTLGEMQAVENSDLLAIRYRGKEFAVGYLQPMGKGRLVVLGVDPNSEVVVALHRWLGVPLHARADASGVHTALFRRDGALFLVASNIAKEERLARVALDGPTAPPGRVRVTDLWSGDSEQMEAVHIKLPPKSGSAWRIDSL